MKSICSLVLLTAAYTLFAVGCSSATQQVSKNTESSNTEWDYEVFSFNLEVTHKNGYGDAMKFNTSTSQFGGTIKHIEENGWEYVGVVHVAGELQNNFTYVLFRKPQQ